MNIGSAPDAFEAALTADGTVVATQAVSVGANATANVTVASPLNSFESVTLQLAAQSIGTITRLSEEPPVPGGDDDTADASAQANITEMGAVDVDDNASLGLVVSRVLGSRWW
jgi:hypothetical protein